MKGMIRVERHTINRPGLLAFLLFFSLKTFSAPLYFEPVSKVLPDGSTLNIYISGDEFFNYLHDASGYPVGQGRDGYYYYLIQKEDEFFPTIYRIGEYDPVLIPGMTKVKVPAATKQKRDAWYNEMEKLAAREGMKSMTGTTGVFNNLVVYIKFLNEPEFTVSRSTYETRFNSISVSSLRSYYREVSYNTLDVVSYHMPGGATENLCYTDQNPRSYYRPYNETTNPDGYKNSTEKTTREHSLLASAISWLKNNYTLPPDVNFDSNSDGNFDNVSFIVKGSPDGWSDLLWPHRWVLYSSVVKWGALRVYGYTLQLENSGVTTIAHEMFHAFGAPDLYHYDTSGTPVGPWDIMGSGKGHMGAWMKYRYGGWIKSIKEINGSGTYSVKPLLQASGNSYLLRSSNSSNQFFVIEFRKKEGLFEAGLPASGIIITRIDTRYRGNSGGPPDEVYVFRKNGTLNSNGDINTAAFSDLYGQTVFSDNSNPAAFLQDGSPTGINISSILFRNDSMLFTVEMDYPYDITLTPEEDSTLLLSWKSAWNRDFLVAVSSSPEDLSLAQGVRYKPGDKLGTGGEIIYFGPAGTLRHTGLKSDERYFYTIWTIISKDPPVYSTPSLVNGKTGIFTITKYPYIQDFDKSYSELPRGWKVTGENDPEYLNGLYPFSPPNSLEISPANPDYEWLYTPAFHLSSSKKYMITFRYRNKTGGDYGSLYLAAATGSRENLSPHGLTVTLLNKFSFSDYVFSRSVFTPGVSGLYYMGFRLRQGGGGVLVDDFRIDEVPLKTVNLIKPSEFYPNPGNGKIIIPAKGRTEISVFSTGGRKMYETTIESMQELDLSFLGRGVFIIRFSDDSGKSSGRLVII